MKRLVLCLDGTWNNTSREIERDDGSRVYRPTNVLKVARAVVARDRKGVLQLTYYDPGVGSMNRAPDTGARIVRAVENLVGGGWGAGFEANIEEAYTFLANNYEPKDEVFIFGFSRGAAQARSLCTLIEYAEGVPTKDDAYYAPRIFGEYLQDRGRVREPTLWKRLNARRHEQKREELEPMVPIPITFLGLWDTVLALGSRLRGGSKTTGEDRCFHTPSKPPRNVDRIRHALAIDESRDDFMPEIFDSPSDHPSLEQRWFAGVHSNVGGGLRSDGLANCALRWITNEAVAAGLELHSEFVQHYREWPTDKAGEKSAVFAFTDLFLSPFRGYHGARDLNAREGITLDPSVYERLNAQPTEDRGMEQPYRPENLMRWLATHTECDRELSGAVLKAVQSRRPAPERSIA